MMTNMSCTRYRNTYIDLLDCQKDMAITPFINLSKSEDKHRLKLIKLCKQIVDDWGND